MNYMINPTLHTSTPTLERVVVRYTIQADAHHFGDEHEIEYDVAAGV